MMNQNGTTQILKLVLTATAMIILTSCGNTKSSQNLSANTFSSTSTKILASCNKTITSDLSFNTAAVQDQLGNVDGNWLKLKFNSMSSKATATGNIVKFYRWKMNSGVSYLDQNPLSISTYNISSGVATSAAYQITASTISTTQGFYLQLNDAAATYQVIKAVIYNSAGAVVTQSDSLIPQFSAKMTDYQYNSDGSARSSNLQSLHPLANLSTSGWSDAQYTSYFQAFCF